MAFDITSGIAIGSLGIAALTVYYNRTERRSAIRLEYYRKRFDVLSAQLTMMSELVDALSSWSLASAVDYPNHENRYDRVFQAKSQIEATNGERILAFPQKLIDLHLAFMGAAYERIQVIDAYNRFKAESKKRGKDEDLDGTDLEIAYKEKLAFQERHLALFDQFCTETRKYMLVEELDRELVGRKHRLRT